MGADLMRKEARKRKFDGQTCMSRIEIGTQLNEGTSPDHPPKKKSKHTHESPVFSKNTGTAENITAGKLAVADISTDWGKEESPSTAIRKAQRFIVFIGTSNSLIYADLNRLTVLLLLQETYLILQRMNQSAAIFWRSILYQSGTRKRRKRGSLKASLSWSLKKMIE